MSKAAAAQRAEAVVHDLERVRALGVEPHLADLVLEEARFARHDSRKLAQLVLDLATKPRLQQRPSGAG